MSAQPPEAAADVWGADRVYPDGSFMFQCHLFGYIDFASRLAPSALVLDLACGEGYGAAVLAARGHRTVALDLDPKMLADSARRYRAASFVAGDALRLPFDDAVFDGVGALQVIEHLEREATQPFLAEIARVLKPGAQLYCTTPNIAKLPTTASKEFNPHHLRDFTPDELGAELSEHFGTFELLGQVMDETLPRAQRLIEGAQREWAVIGRVERVERAVRNLPGPLRVRLRRFLLRVAGIRAWPLPDVEAARNEIRADDFRALAPAEASGNTIAIARR